MAGPSNLRSNFVHDVACLVVDDAMTVGVALSVVIAVPAQAADWPAHRSAAALASFDPAPWASGSCATG